MRTRARYPPAPPRKKPGLSRAFSLVKKTRVSRPGGREQFESVHGVIAWLSETEIERAKRVLRYPPAPPFDALRLLTVRS